MKNIIIIFNIVSFINRLLNYNQTNSPFFKTCRILSFFASIFFASCNPTGDYNKTTNIISADLSKEKAEISIRIPDPNHVTTILGKKQYKARIDGNFKEAQIQRPWFLLKDKNNVLYFIEEGRGNRQNGALIIVGKESVTTLLQCNSEVFQSPTALAFNLNEDTLYITNTSSFEVQTFANLLYCTRKDNFKTVKALCYFENARTQAIAVHPHTGELFFNNQVNGYIYQYTGEGDIPYKALFQVNNSEDTELRLLFSRDGKTLYIVVRNKHCIYKADYDEYNKQFSHPVLWIGEWGKAGYINEYGRKARLNNPGQPALDSNNNLYIPDKDNHCIRKITPNGEVSLVSGNPLESGYKNGEFKDALFNTPEAAIFFDENLLYVAERDNHCIRCLNIN